ncbi:MAG: NUDIX hydrolase [Ferruginibacter sp.]
MNLQPSTMNWKTLSSTYINKHTYFTARQDRCERPDGLIVDPYFVVELPTTVCALPITENNEVLLVKQYRHPIGQTILEIPGGFADPGEDMENAMARELLEETGYAFSQFDYLGKIAANPGVLDNFTYLYLAKGGKKVAAQKLDDNEEIEIVTVSLDELKRMVRDCEIVQALHLSCVFYALEKLGR